MDDLFERARKKALEAAKGVVNTPDLGEESVAAAAVAAAGLTKAVTVNGVNEYYGVSIASLLNIIQETVKRMPHVFCETSRNSARISVLNDKGVSVEIATFNFIQDDDKVTMRVDLREATVQAGTFTQLANAAGEVVTTLGNASKKGLNSIFSAMTSLGSKLMNAESQGKILARIAKQIEDAVNNYAQPISQAYKTQKDLARVQAQDKEQRQLNLYTCRNCGKPRPEDTEGVVACSCGQWFESIKK